MPRASVSPYERMGSWSQRPPPPPPASSPEVGGPMSFLLRDAAGIHARVRSSSGVRAPLAPAPRESWGTVRSHEPRCGTPLWGEGNRPKRQEARGAGGPAGGRGRLLCAATVPSCPVMVLPAQLSAGLRAAFGARRAAGRRLGPRVGARGWWGFSPPVGTETA